MSWFSFIIGCLATFRLSHLMTIERGPLAIFERIRNAFPQRKGGVKEWLSCIFCFSLTASSIVCGLIWVGGRSLHWSEWILYWLAFSAAALIINQTTMKEARK